MVSEWRERSHEQYADDASAVRELVVRGAVQYLCRDGAKGPPSDIELDIAPAVWIEVVKQRGHVAREAVDVGHVWGRGGSVSPTGERGADVMDVL